MGGKARLARRSLLLGSALVAASLARPQVPLPVDEVAHAATEAFLSRLVPYPSVASLAAAEGALPPSVRAELQGRAREAAVAYRDYLAFSVMEALPVSPSVLGTYVPRMLLFAVPAAAMQVGLVGAAWLPLEAGVHWQQSGSTAGLAVTGRPGWAVAAGNGLVAAVTSGPEATRLGPGVPPVLANRLALQHGRSREGVLASLTSLTPCRAARHLIYDAVERELSLAESGREWEVSALTAPATVVAPIAGDAAGNAESLERSLAANRGWLDVAKAIALLRLAAPGCDCLVLDAEAGIGTMVVGGVSRSLAF